MNEEKLFAGFKSLCEEDLDAIAGGLLDGKQAEALAETTRLFKADRPLDFALGAWQDVAARCHFDDETIAQGEDIIRSVYAE